MSETSLAQEGALEEHIKRLEEVILHSNYKENPSVVYRLIDHEFEEISSSGRVTERDEVLSWLRNKDPGERWLLQNFRIKYLSPDIVLAIYHAKKSTDSKHDSQASLRSSIWKRHGNSWKILFHQASKY